MRKLSKLGNKINLLKLKSKDFKLSGKAGNKINLLLLQSKDFKLSGKDGK